jgi:nucleotidyltransferase/DNA polymerase involved in DNA repair
MRKIIHVDMDCFYAAVEMRDNPALRDIPIAKKARKIRIANRITLLSLLTCTQP